jgi:hypothetical protein
MIHKHFLKTYLFLQVVELLLQLEILQQRLF